MEWGLYFSTIDFLSHLGISKPQTFSRRKQKGCLTSPYGSFNSHNYIDAFRVPGGVPDEFKAKNQIAAGFESTLFWWYMINKNVDWINYIWYKQERFMNYIRDALKRMTGQLVKWHRKTEWL
jgi:hypothetical protein